MSISRPSVQLKEHEATVLERTANSKVAEWDPSEELDPVACNISVWRFMSGFIVRPCCEKPLGTMFDEI
jgi:hypothetical protein